ncbi:MAG: hypothetical protein GC152_16050 [Alphaproteobacteria bacterium]|nr:hypothetical protein [Alphaproteobacteria bacterium]
MRPGAYIFVAIILSIAAGWAIRRAWRRSRRARLRASALPEHLAAALRSQYPVYGRLPAALRTRLDGLVNQFLDEIRFIGVEGVDPTDEMKALIAAQACLLVAGRTDAWYDDLDTIYVYPSGYAGKEISREGHVVTESASTRLGESWTRGPVVLSWADARAGAREDGDGRNLVYHEFAHRLDARTGVVDGAPLLGDAARAASWAKTFRPLFEEHRAAVDAGRATFFDAYGATSPAEFFAVVTEAFIERAHEFRAAEPRLYAVVEGYYRLSPHEWS